MSYNSSATIKVTNNTGGNAIITFSHEYSDEGVQVWGPSKVAPGENAGPLSVGFNTGFIRSGQDYWFCGVQVLDGPNAGTYATEGSVDDPVKQCTLESEDNGSTLTFSVTTENFVMTENSGSCSTAMNAANAAAAIAAKQPKRLAAASVKVAAAK
jgi:PUD1/2-like protein